MKKKIKDTRVRVIVEPDAEAIVQAYMRKSGLNKQRAVNGLLRLAGKIKRLVPEQQKTGAV